MAMELSAKRGVSVVGKHTLRSRVGRSTLRGASGLATTLRDGVAVVSMSSGRGGVEEQGAKSSGGGSVAVEGATSSSGGSVRSRTDSGQSGVAHIPVRMYVDAASDSRFVIPAGLPYNFATESRFYDIFPLY